jgi:Spx/MgsR family transcriptional regulator
MISMYAIPNCDTVKKARAFLEKNKIDYEFIDFKKSPPTKAQIKAWSDYAGELPVNKKGMTYRKYKDQYEALSIPEQIEFIIANTSLIKRPVLVQNDKAIALGFNEEQYKELLGTINPKRD